MDGEEISKKLVQKDKQYFTSQISSTNMTAWTFNPYTTIIHAAKDDHLLQLGMDIISIECMSMSLSYFSSFWVLIHPFRTPFIHKFLILGVKTYRHLFHRRCSTVQSPKPIKLIYTTFEKLLRFLHESYGGESVNWVFQLPRSINSCKVFAENNLREHIYAGENMARIFFFLNRK